MKKTIFACVVTGCFALAGGGAVAGDGAHHANGKRAQHRDPMQASASMTTTAAAPVRYDSACRSQHGFGSSGYHNCLQRLPATALIGGR
jgi:hypothetical protein